MKKMLLITAFVISSTFAFAQFASNGYYGGQGNGGGYGHNHGAEHGPPFMTQREFTMAKDAVARQRFDSDRLITAKEIARMNRMKSCQVRDLMILLSFESSRLDFAKAAYRNVFDPQNYYLVNDGFRFSSSSRELDQFIRSGGMGGSCGMNAGSGGGFGVNAGASSGFGVNSGAGFNSGGTLTIIDGGHQVVPVNNFPACGMCSDHHDPGLVCEMEFERIICSVNKQCFEHDKLRVAKQAFGQRWMLADQVRRTMEVFTFEDTRLKFAKFGYLRTVDVENFYVVNDAFNFSTSIHELDLYIRHV